MQHPVLLALLSCLVAVPFVQGQAQTDTQAKIEDAMSAAPPSISANATILDYPAEPGSERIVLRKGTNEWTCLPDNPNLPAKNPMCVDDQWMELFGAVADKRDPNFTQIGFAYFLQGGPPRSNTNPWDTGMTPDNEWMEVQVPHVGIVYPDKAPLEGVPTDPNNGGPWVMWRNTPYVHIMLPMPKHVPDKR